MDTPDNRKLNIVDENGKIIGEETRDTIHRLGLLHREIHVLFYTAFGEIIFQHRGRSKDTHPDLLAATVGGHVEIGLDFVDTAIKETEEETGIRVKKKELVFLKKLRTNSYDRITDKTNNTIRVVFAYHYGGKIEDLIVEKDEAMGFEAWLLNTLFNLSESDKGKFIPAMLTKEYMDVFRQIRDLV